MNSRCLLFLGARKGAILTAHRLGFHITLISENLPNMLKNYVHDYIPHDLSLSDSDFLDQIESPLTKTNSFRVFALTEKAVVLAGLIRERLGIPGLGSLQSQRGHDKFLMKTYLQTHGIALTDFELIESAEQLKTLEQKLGWPIILKPRKLSGGRGLRLAKNAEELKKKCNLDDIAERFIDGTEGSVESYIIDSQVVFHNITHYHKHHTINHLPSQLPDHEQKNILQLNQTVIKALGIKQGLTHIEFYRTPKGLIFGEIALRPPGGYIMNLLKIAYNFDPWEAWIKLECNESVSLPTQALKQTASWVIHPGEGKIKKIFDLAQLKKEKFVTKARLRIKENELLKVRLGSGTDCGHVLFAAPMGEDLLAHVDHCMDSYKIIMHPET